MVSSDSNRSPLHKVPLIRLRKAHFLLLVWGLFLVSLFMGIEPTVTEKFIEENPERTYWKPHPGPQSLAFTCDADEVMMDGGRGSGKSEWLMGHVVERVGQYGGKCNMVMCRATSLDLEDLIEKGKQVLVDQGLAVYVGGAARQFRFTGVNRGATLKMWTIHHANQLRKFKGQEFDLIMMDEITEYPIPFYFMMDAIRASNRNKFGIPNRIKYTSNPGGYNHVSVKQYFVDPYPPGKRMIVNAMGRTRMRIGSTVMDNPTLMETEDYLNTLKSIQDPEQRKAWVEGSWDVAMGAMFQDLWSPSKHIIGRITPKDIPQNIPRYRGFDWGSATPFCYLNYFIAGSDEILNGMSFPKGSIVWYKEMYGWKQGTTPNMGLLQTSVQLADWLQKFEKSDGDHRFVRPGPADGQIYETQPNGRSIADDFTAKKINFIRANKAPGSEALGNEMIRSRLLGVDGKPAMYFTEDCVNCIRILPAMIRDDINRHVLKNSQEDHCTDVIRYVSLHHHYTPPDKGEVERKRSDIEMQLTRLKRLRGDSYIM